MDAGTAFAVAALVIWGDVVSQITQAIISFFQSIWSGVSNFFGTIFQSIANVIAAIFQAPVNAINSSWTAFQTWANGLGPVAPFLTVVMVAAIVLLGVFIVWIVIKLSVSEAEGVGTEVEEGV